jgi:hypothetical protein
MVSSSSEDKNVLPHPSHQSLVSANQLTTPYSLEITCKGYLFHNLHAKLLLTARLLHYQIDDLHVILHMLCGILLQPACLIADVQPLQQKGPLPQPATLDVADLDQEAILHYQLGCNTQNKHLTVFHVFCQEPTLPCDQYYPVHYHHRLGMDILPTNFGQVKIFNILVRSNDAFHFMRITNTISAMFYSLAETSTNNWSEAAMHSIASYLPYSRRPPAVTKDEEPRVQQCYFLHPQQQLGVHAHSPPVDPVLLLRDDTLGLKDIPWQPGSMLNMSKHRTVNKPNMGSHSAEGFMKSQLVSTPHVTTPTFFL